MADTHTELTRRSVLQSAAGASIGFGVTACASSDSGAAPPPYRDAFDLSVPQDNVEAIVKMRGDLSGKPSYMWRHGHIFGVVEGQMAIPMMQYQSAQIGRFFRNTDGSYLFKYRGLFVYQDFDSGEFIDEFQNPFTRETVEVRHFKTSIGEFSYTTLGPKASRVFEGNTGRPHGTPYVLPWVRSGDYVWVTLDERVEYARPSDGVWRRDNALIRYETLWDELMDPERSSASVSTSFHTHVDWFTWLNMQGHSGGLMQGGAGRKFFKLEDLPADLVAFSEARFPGSLTDPITRD